MRDAAASGGIQNVLDKQRVDAPRNVGLNRHTVLLYSKEIDVIRNCAFMFPTMSSTFELMHRVFETRIAKTISVTYRG